MDDREEVEHVPWQDLLAEAEPDDQRRRSIYLGAGLIGAMIVGMLVARSWWSPAPLQAPLAPGTSVVEEGGAPVDEAGDEIPLPDLPAFPLYAEADLMAHPPDAQERIAIMKAEWFVIDYFTADLEPNGSADIRAALPPGSLPEFPQDSGDSISYVEWARAFRVEPAGPDAYRVTVAFRTLAAPPDRGFTRQPVRAVEVLVGVLGDGGAAVLDLPSPVGLPAGPEPAPWPEAAADPPPTVVEAAASRAALWGTEPRVVSVHRLERGWRVVLTVADAAGNRWPLSVMVEFQ